MIAIKEGTFQMMKPIFSKRGFWIVGAMVGAEKGMAYTKRVATPDRIPFETERIRMQIYQEHPGIVETPFTHGVVQREPLRAK